MGRFKRRGSLCNRPYLLCLIGTITTVTLLYELTIFLSIDKIDHVGSNSYYSETGNAAGGDDSIVVVADDSRVSGSGPGSRSAGRVHADVVLNELAGTRHEKVDELEDLKVINSVHYVWCRNKTFEFVNYLSVLSVWKILRPDIIEFHLTVHPKADKYDDWFEELKRTIPSFALKAMPQHWDGDDKGCGFWFGLAVIDDRGGIYVNENVIVTDDIVKYRLRDIAALFSRFKSDSEETPDVALAMGQSHQPHFRNFRHSMDKSPLVKDKADFCEILDGRLVNSTTAPCFLVNHPINPRNIHQLDTPFAALARRLMYGSERIKETRPILPGTIPKIVHYVWFGLKDMDFMMYLSMLSTLYIVNPDKVLVHTDGGLTGRYWTKLLKDKRIVILLREKPFDIYGHQVLYAQHRSDIVRAECLLKYGGIYMDWDVLWLRNPDELLQTGYDAIANFDHMQQGKYPETINLGVLMAKPKSTFIKKWQDALINYRSEDFLYNAVLLPYKVYERYPEYLYIERRLQVMCFRLKCHPTFQENFKNYMEEQPFDWRKDVFSIHFTFPDPDELLSEQKCRNGEGKFAEMGRHILQHEYKLPK